MKVEGKKRTDSSSGSGKKLSHFRKKDSHALQQSLALGRKSSIGIEEPSGTEPFEIAAFFLLRSRFFDRRLEREADDQGCLPSRYSFSDFTHHETSQASFECDCALCTSTRFSRPHLFAAFRRLPGCYKSDRRDAFSQ